MNTPPKFTKREQKKVQEVLDIIKRQASAELELSKSLYNNDFGCGNCGDMGPLFTTLSRVARLVGIKDRW